MNNYFEYEILLKQFGASKYNRILNTAKNNPAINSIHSNICSIYTFSIIESISLYLLFKQKKTIKTLIIPTALITLLNMNLFLRNSLNEHPFINNDDLNTQSTNKLTKFLQSTTGPLFCIRKDAFFLTITTFFYSLFN